MIYADNAATTKMSRTAIDAMIPYLEEDFGNPSSLHTIGQRANEALTAARETVAQCLGAQPGEIYFTSGGSEADNQAIRSAARIGRARGKTHIISTTPSSTPSSSLRPRASRSPSWTWAPRAWSPRSRWTPPSGRTPSW